MQVVGIFALVASLIFVGIQLKQDREIARVELYQSRAAVAGVIPRIVLRVDSRNRQGAGSGGLGNPVTHELAMCVIAGQRDSVPGIGIGICL